MEQFEDYHAVPEMHAWSQFRQILQQTEMK